MALTDVENLYGQIKFHHAARAYGIKPITGVELRHGYAPARLGSKKGRLVLLARDRSGYESLCRIIEHAPDLDQVPAELITHHINAIQAIVRERTKLDTATMASKLSKQLRGVADEFLLKVNRDRPEHLEAILAPSIVPAE